jgi:dihydroneopterin aldolase
MDKTFITDLKIQTLIGVHPNERNQTRELILQIVLYHSTKLAGSSDRIEDCINYQWVAEKIAAFGRDARRFTVEAFADDIASLCLEQFGVEGVNIRVDKPGAVDGARSVGVEIERYR